MLVNRTHKILMEQAGGSNDGGGGSGGGSLLTPSSGGGQPPAAGGGANSPNPADSKGAAAGGGVPNPAPGGNQTFDWKSTLPAELRDNPSIKLFNDLPALAQSFIKSQSMIGADKIVVPGKNATDDDWKGVFSKLGLPETVDKYDLKFQEGVTIDKDFTDNFKKVAHQAGILPKQAQALADWFSKSNQEAEGKTMETLKAQRTQQLEGLKTEWGAAFDKNLQKAQQVVTELGDKDLIEFLDKTGLGDDVRMVKLFSAMGQKFLAEGKEIGARGTNEPVMTPADARKEHTAIMSNMEHPYWKKEHPGHKAAVQEVTNLFKMMNPAKSTIDKNL
jgi:hypothetical protein